MPRNSTLVCLDQVTLPILYQDPHYVAIDKPSGLLVHRSPIDKHATAFALQMLRDQLQREVHPCHRLDRPTSGVLLFALSPDANRAAQSLFLAGEVEKTYEAVVRGWTPSEGTIDYALRSEEDPEKIQDAETRYRCLKHSTVKVPVGRYAEARFSRVEINPLSGRKHQIRRHFAHIRHPILGDTRHGDGAQNKFLREYAEGSHLMLRATELSFVQPFRKSIVQIKAPADHEFERVAAELKL